MNVSTSTFPVIIHALLHAAAILFASYFLGDSEHQQTVTYLIIALWFASSTLLFGNQKSLQCEWAAIRRLFHSENKGKS